MFLSLWMNYALHPKQQLLSSAQTSMWAWIIMPQRNLGTYNEMIRRTNSVLFNNLSILRSQLALVRQNSSIAHRIGQGLITVSDWQNWLGNSVHLSRWKTEQLTLSLEGNKGARIGTNSSRSETSLRFKIPKLWWSLNPKKSLSPKLCLLDIESVPVS